jgi:hypothetical protein
MLLPARGSEVVRVVGLHSRDGLRSACAAPRDDLPRHAGIATAGWWCLRVPTCEGARDTPGFKLDRVAAVPAGPIEPHRF